MNSLGVKRENTARHPPIVMAADPLTCHHFIFDSCERWILSVLAPQHDSVFKSAPKLKGSLRCCCFIFGAQCKLFNFTNKRTKALNLMGVLHSKFSIL